MKEQSKAPKAAKKPTKPKTSKKSIPQIMNLSLNNKDLRIQIITNKIIKQKSEEITGKDLTPLFELLEISYT